MLSHAVMSNSFATLWTLAHQAPLSMGFYRHKYWRGLPYSPPGHLPDPQTKPISLLSSTLAGRFFTTSATWETQTWSSVQFNHSVMSDSLRLHEYSTPGLPVHHQLLEFTQTHVHQVSDAIQPSHPLSSPSPPAPNPSQHQGLFQ